MGRPRLHAAPSTARAFTCFRCGEVRQAGDAYFSENGKFHGWCAPCLIEYGKQRHRDTYVPIRLEKVCVYCSARFVTPYAGKIYCNRVCITAARSDRQKAERAAARPERTCQHCGGPIARTQRSDAKFCSETCNSAAHQWWRKSAARTGTTREAAREIGRVGIAERDGWICQLCEEPVDKTLRHPDLASSSIDHVVPRISWRQSRQGQPAALAPGLQPPQTQPTRGERMSENESTAKVETTDADTPAERTTKAAEATEAAVAETLRGNYVRGLTNERDQLARQPVPNAKRLAEVEAELARYAEKPAKAPREKAVRARKATA